MQRSAQMTGVTFGIQFLGDRQRVGIGLDHCVEQRIEGRDLIEVICR